MVCWAPNPGALTELIRGETQAPAYFESSPGGLSEQLGLRTSGFEMGTLDVGSGGLSRRCSQAS